jgi:hypothetical protein
MIPSPYPTEASQMRFLSISKRLPNITAFHENLDFTAGLAKNSLFSGDTSDVASMSQVEDIGEDYEEQIIFCSS